jgi:hypothetical protein
MKPFRAMAIATTIALAACGSSSGDSNGSVSTTDPVDAALATAYAKGFTSCQKDAYGNTFVSLHVLICNAGDNFADSTYVGTDAPEPSGRLVVIWHQRNAVAVLYGLYMPNDGDCCPTGGGTTVQFLWDGKAMTTMGQIPTDKRNVPGSRR